MLHDVHIAHNNYVTPGSGWPNSIDMCGLH